MATAHGSAWPLSDSPTHFAPPTDDPLAAITHGPQASSSDDDAPPPNPPFMFPGLPSSPSSTSSTTGRASRRRPASAVDNATDASDRPVGMAALPVFSFNPGAALPPDPNSLLSPPVTPNSPRATPSLARPAGHGHRRGGSEFVGGRLREGNSIAVMSTSPTKSESGFASPTLQPPRRGHRRGISGTISTNDLPFLHPPVDMPLPKGSSAPNSPTNFDHKENSSLPPIDIMQSLPEPIQPANRQRSPRDFDDNSTTSTSSSPKHAKPATKARVGFSDTLEFIPRPLSLVSSDTSSIATARRGHSLSGSISSIVSAASPSERSSPAHLVRSPTRPTRDSRPSTAGAILETTIEAQTATASNTSPRRRNSIPNLLVIPDPASVDPGTPSPTKVSRRWTFFGLEALAGSGSPTKARRPSTSSSDSSCRPNFAGSNSDLASESSSEVAETSQKKTKRKSKKKSVKGWAGAILPLKPKNQKKQLKSTSARPPTPPASIQPMDDEDDDVERPQTRDQEPTTPTVTITESLTPPRQPKLSRSADDMSYPMIDLDAALGPFNTPLPHNPEWEAAQRAAGNVGKRRLHSAQGMKGFSGPGMHYHRRAESAPALPPFDPGRFPIHRFNSSSTMADVFEEEEEGPEFKSEASDESDGESTPQAESKESPVIPGLQDNASHRLRRTSSGPSDKDQIIAHAIRAEVSKNSLQESVILEEPSSSIFRTTNTFQGRRGSSDSAAPSPKKLCSARELPPVEVGSPNPPASTFIPNSPYSMSLGSSSHPSPRSPMSIDAQRISTAPSSVTDENSFHSLLMGEPGPEVRVSVDYDVPSLTSSRSTMTRESSFIPNLRMSQPTARDQRPMSVSSAAFGRRRSSLVSLSRLISSSHGERSKLSMEVTLDGEGDHRRSRDSRTKRFGRMMQFWKPQKDEQST